MTANAISNADLAQQLGKVQGSLEYLIKETDRAKDERGKLYNRIEAAEQSAASAARAAAAAAARIEALQSEINQKVSPAVEEFRNLKTKAAGVVLVLVFIGSIITAIATVFIQEIKTWFAGLFQ